MENIWITTAEIGVEPGDMPSGDTLGFMKVTMWASSREDFATKLNVYLSKYKWKLLSIENTDVVESDAESEALGTCPISRFYRELTAWARC
jgi:hypothetical protein